ncbi:helix-turn-helix domain-containing protein [Pseudoroseomonas sp. WGS1072]|uniref:helix-turn-helix domain-containing protein n=1 Tax=Roseomonas sp. WGS1072 TaxID=3366816 RepID=UPI003BF17664
MARVKATPESVAKALSATDWQAIDAMTDEDIARQIADDPDVAPDTSGMSETQVLGAQVRAVRRRLGLTQPEFAARYRIPVGTVRDWEQGRARPDQPARAYLHAISRTPDAVAAAVADMPR